MGLRDWGVEHNPVAGEGGEIWEKALGRGVKEVDDCFLTFPRDFHGWTLSQAQPLHEFVTFHLSHVKPQGPEFVRFFRRAGYARAEDKTRPGLCLKAAGHLFSEAGLQGSQIEVQASFLQLYLNHITDLLAPSFGVEGSFGQGARGGDGSSTCFAAFGGGGGGNAGCLRRQVSGLGSESFGLGI